ncbi:hypothetical protein D3C87_2101220 [compost metagenome]
MSVNWKYSGMTPLLLHVISVEFIVVVKYGISHWNKAAISKSLWAIILSLARSFFVLSLDSSVSRSAGDFK